MAILQDEDARFKNLARKIGWFVLIALAGIAATIVAIGTQHDVFTPKTRISFVTDTGQDISAGMPVKLSGFVIGKVEKLALTDDAEVEVTLSINTPYMKWVRKDSRARLVAEGLIGRTIIEVSPGSEKAKPLARNEKIPFERERDLGKVVDALYAQVVPLIADFKSIARKVDELLAHMPPTLDKLDGTLGSAEKSMQGIERIMNAELPGVIRRGDEVLAGSKKVVDSVSRTWPINLNIEPPKAQTLPVDSYVPDQVPKQK